MFEKHLQSVGFPNFICIYKQTNISVVWLLPEFVTQNDHGDVIFFNGKTTELCFDLQF